MKKLPLYHAIRNLGRRPLRSLLIVFGSALVAGLLVATSAFVRSLERSHVGAAPPRTALLISTSAMNDIVRSAMSPAVADLVAADVPGILSNGGLPASSPEIHMGTEIIIPGVEGARQAFVRGITERAYLVHTAVTLLEGHLPGPGEALVGRLAAAKSGLDDDVLVIGNSVSIEGGSFRISGIFSAPGTTIESEIWVGLSELQGLSQRDDCSTVFVRVKSDDDLADVDLFALRRLDLELLSIPAKKYYAELAAYFDPILALAWAMAVLIGLSAALGGANIVMASIQERTRELSMFRAMGYRSLSLSASILQEVLTLSLAGALLGLVLVRFLLREASVSMAMTAFRLEINAVSVLIGLCGVLAIAALGALPALLRIARVPIAVGLKES